ncbi:MAG: adenylate/guanylate cyclase domain-containing protein [Acidiferrobacterales bacterium]
MENPGTLKPEKHEESTSDSRAGRKGSRDELVLVVDDNENNRYTLTRRLQRIGFENVMSAEDGRQALDLIGKHRFDLVFLDIMMPEVDGYTVLEQLRAEGQLANLPVIVISALDEIDSVVRCIELGAEDYLPKPFNPTLLKARVNATLEKKRLRDEVTQQLAIIRDVFGKYVPESVAEAIVAGAGSLKPTQTTATILYSDIESFTTIAESMPPEQVVQMLNEYFPAVIEPIKRHGGVVNQFQGDAMLVTFNVPVEDPQHADKAVTVAGEMQRAVQGQTFAGVTLGTRIGINTGPVIAGNVGSGDRINYTVHGDAVNLAARLEQLNKEHGTRVLVSGTTVSLLNSNHPLEPIGEVEIRGKHEPVQIFKLTV